MNIRKAVKVGFVLAVTGICGMGIVNMTGIGSFPVMHRQKAGQAEESVQTSMAEPSSEEGIGAPAAFLEENAAGAAFDQDTAPATASPQPDSSKAVKKHRDGKAVWTYHKQTRCLVISGKGKIVAGGAGEMHFGPDSSDIWAEPSYRPKYLGQVEKIIIKPGITQINAGAFFDYPSLKTVKISDTVAMVGEYAFFRCTSLKKITLGKGVRKLDRGAFRACSDLEEFTIGRGVEELGTDVFSGCSSLRRISVEHGNASFATEAGLLYDRQKTVLYRCPSKKKNAVIWQGIKEIAPAAFDYCRRLKKITIPATVEQLGSGAFYHCSSLEEISFPKSSRCCFVGSRAFDDCESLKEIILPDSVKYIGGIFTRCNSLRRVDLGMAGFTSADTWEEARKGDVGEPSHDTFMSGFSYGRIEEYRVSEANPWYSSQDGVLYNKARTRLLCYPPGKRDTTVRIPDSVRVIKGEAFYCNRYAEKVIASNSLKKIGGWAFGWCKSLQSAKIMGKGVVIGTSAFACSQSMSHVELGSGVKEIKPNAFYDTGLKEIHIPASVKKIGKDALGMWCERTQLDGVSSGKKRKVIGFMIYGKKGSAAQRYAEEHVFDFLAE